MHINALTRHYKFIVDPKFKETMVHELKARRTLLKNSYEEFMTEHTNEVEKCDKKKFDELDSICEMIEGRFTVTLAAINKRIEELENKQKSAERNDESANTSAKGEMVKNEEACEPTMSEMSEGRRKIVIRQRSDDEGELIIKNDVQLAISDEEPSSSSLEEQSRIPEVPEDDLRRRIEDFKRANERYQRESFEFLNRSGLTCQQQHLAANQDRNQQYETRPGQYSAGYAPRQKIPYKRPTATYVPPRAMPYMARNPYKTPNMENYYQPSTTQSEKRVIICNNCGGSHPMCHCEKFLARSIDERWERVRQLKLCPNCLLPFYYVTGTHRCKARPCKCGGHHNTLLCRFQRRNN